MKHKLVVAFLAACPVALFAFSTGPLIKRTGAAIDGGVSCTACHTTYAPANSDARGSVTINALNYTPGKTQVLEVSVQHPDALRWGFQLIARLSSDQTAQAGVFSVDDIVRVRCLTGDAPCNGGQEYAEHVSAPRTAAGVGYVFKVTWTPPAKDVGNVIFYAAGNAANGDGTLQGDRIYTTLKTVSPVRPCTLTAKPAVTSVQNAASFVTSIGPGAIISLFGSGFQTAGTAIAPAAADFVDNGYPRQLSCMAVEVDGKRAPITFASDKQINVQAPQSLKAGPVQVRVLANPDLTNLVAGDPVTVTVQTLSPGFFAFGKTGVAASVVNSATPIADAATIPGAVAAKPGDVVTLWATGLGATKGAVPEGLLATAASAYTGVISLTIGGVSVPPADILYAGVSPGSISGLSQINVKLPGGLPDGPATVQMQVDGVKAQDGLTLPVKR